MEHLKDIEDTHHWAALWSLGITPDDYLPIFEGRKYWAPRCVSPSTSHPEDLVNADAPRVRLTESSVMRSLDHNKQFLFQSCAAQCTAVLIRAYSYETGKDIEDICGGNPTQDLDPVLRSMAEAESLYRSAPQDIKEAAAEVAKLALTSIPPAKVNRAHKILALSYAMNQPEILHDPEVAQEAILCSISKLSR